MCTDWASKVPNPVAQSEMGLRGMLETAPSSGNVEEQVQ